MFEIRKAHHADELKFRLPALITRELHEFSRTVTVHAPPAEPAPAAPTARLTDICQLFSCQRSVHKAPGPFARFFPN